MDGREEVPSNTGSPTDTTKGPTNRVSLLRTPVYVSVVFVNYTGTVDPNEVLNTSCAEYTRT